MLISLTENFTLVEIKMNTLSREQLIILVNKIINCEGTEKEIDEDLYLLKNSVPHPEVSDLIFYSEKDMTPEEIVDEALSYKPQGFIEQ